MDMILLTSAAAFLVWGAVFLRVAGLWGCILAILIAGTVFGHPFAHVSILTLDRALLSVCLIVYAAYRWYGLEERTAWHWLDSILVCFAASMILSTFMNDWRTDTSSSIGKLIFFFLLPICLYWLGSRVQLTPVHVRWMFGVFAGLGIYLSLTAIAEKFGFEWAVLPRYIVDPSYFEFLGRGRGPLLNPTGNGVLLTLGMCCALMFLENAGKLGRVAVVSTIPVYLIGIYCTMTRCVWIGGAAALVGIAWVATPKRLRIPFVIAVVFGGGILVAVKSESFVGFKRDKNVSVADMKQSAHLRPILAVFAWKMFLDRPMLGCGTGQYLPNVKNYLGERNIDLPLTKAKSYVQHNVFLALLVENGLIGLLPFMVLISCSTWLAWQLWQAKQLALEYRQSGLVFLGFMAAYLANGMFHDLLIVPMIGAYLFFFLGCIRNVTGNHLVSMNRLALSIERGKLPCSTSTTSTRSPSLRLSKSAIRTGS